MPTLDMPPRPTIAAWYAGPSTIPKLNLGGLDLGRSAYLQKDAVD
jgi:hypothetical protein